MEEENSAVELSDALMSGRAARRGGNRRGQRPVISASSFDPRLPSASAWVKRGAARIDDDEFEEMVAEILELNEVEWTGAAGRFKRVSEPAGLMNRLSSLRFDNPASVPRGLRPQTGGPLDPNWDRLESLGVMENWRAAQKAAYAEGSQGKLNSALNRWVQFCAEIAQISFIRPRVGFSPADFTEEVWIQMMFVSWCTMTGCNVNTAEQYLSMVNGWHRTKMGYGISESPFFTDHDMKRVNRGYRRILPSKKLQRAGHPTAINATALRGSLGGIFRIYDEPGQLTDAKLDRMRTLLSRGSSSGLFDKDIFDDLFYSSLTELMTDGLLRPSEALPEGKSKETGERKCNITRDDVQFTCGADGRVVEAIVYIQPIKQYGNKVGNTDKVPIMIAAGREGTLRTAELLDILFRLTCADERGGKTPAFKYPAELVEMTPAKRKQHLFITQDRVMKWYHARCEFHNVANHRLVKMHSFRIGGATALLAANVDPSLIKNKGRWASDVYEIYCRVCKGKMLELSHLMSRADTNQWLSRNDGFFDNAAGCELGPETEEEAAVSECDEDSADEADESSAEEESEDEQSSAEEDHEEDHERRALCAVPRASRRRRRGLKVSHPSPLPTLRRRSPRSEGADSHDRERQAGYSA